MAMILILNCCAFKPQLKGDRISKAVACYSGPLQPCQTVLVQILAPQLSPLARVLLALMQKVVRREEAYRLIQECAVKTWSSDGDFLALLKADKDVRKHMSAREIEANFDLGCHFKDVDAIFKRVLGRQAISRRLRCKRWRRCRRHR
jgi:hypothetical protein